MLTCEASSCSSTGTTCCRCAATFVHYDSIIAQ
jgi:hypothetical protein